MKNTIAYYLSTGDLSKTQTNALLNQMYECATIENDYELGYGGMYDTETNIALDILSHEAISNEDFIPDTITFQDLKHIKTDDKQSWIIHALSSRFEFNSGSYVLKICPF